MSRTYTWSNYPPANHLVCCSCRRVWRDSYNWPIDGPQHKSCPSCGNDLLNAGKGFCAPRRTNLRQWRKVEIILRGGLRLRQFVNTPAEARQAVAARQPSGFVQRDRLR